MPVLTAAEFNTLALECAQEHGSLGGAIKDIQTNAVQAAEAAQREGSLVDIFPSHHQSKGLGKLCRCRGMIQEVNPEMVLFPASRTRLVNATTAPQSRSPTSRTEEDDTEELLDAVLLYVIPVPGNTHFYEGPGSSAGWAEESEGAAVQRQAAGASTSAEPHAVAARKRAVSPNKEREGEEKEEEGAGSWQDGGRAEARRPVIPRTELSGTHATVTPCAPPETLQSHLNLPHPATSTGLQTSCIVTVLLPSAGSEAECEQGRFSLRREGLRTNAVIDFYGFLHFPDDQTEPDILEADEFAQFSSWHVAELTKGLVSRLLCVGYSPVLAPLKQAPRMDYFGTARATALAFLTEELCRGDALLGEYLLLHLCGRVTAHSQATPVGDVPLLVCSPQLVPSQWSERLRRVVPIAEVLLDREVFVKAADRIHPTQDTTRNYLRTGILQLANGTHVTIDCDGLEELIEKPSTSQTKTAVAWSDTLFSLIHKQSLPLDYAFQTVELAVDVSFLALATVPAHGRVPNALNFPLRVDWRPSECDNGAAGEAPREDAARAYLGTVMRVEAQLDGDAPRDDETLRTHITEAFLALSSEYSGWNNRDPLIHNNTFSAVTALMCAMATSNGRSHVTIADVDAVIALERRRASRLGTSH